MAPLQIRSQQTFLHFLILLKRANSDQHYNCSLSGNKHSKLRCLRDQCLTYLVCAGSHFPLFSRRWNNEAQRVNATVLEVQKTNDYIIPTALMYYILNTRNDIIIFDRYLNHIFVVIFVVPSDVLTRTEEKKKGSTGHDVCLHLKRVKSISCPHTFAICQV